MCMDLQGFVGMCMDLQGFVGMCMRVENVGHAVVHMCMGLVGLEGG